jgi:hypothetical protein
MKKYFFFLIALLLYASGSFAQCVAINTDHAAPDGSAMLDVSSTIGGMLIPRMTKVQRDAIGSPATGLLIYQTDDTPGFYHYNATSWRLVGAEAFCIDDLWDGKTEGNSVFLGAGAGANDDGVSNFNVAIGPGSLNNNDTGSYNTCIGYQAGQYCMGSGNVLIGANADAIGNNYLVISNATFSPLVSGKFDTKLFIVHGTLGVNNEYEFPLSDGTIGQVLRTNGSGDLSWEKDEGATEIDALNDASNDGSSIFLGAGSGADDDGSNENIGVGLNVLHESTSGNYNSALGNLSLYSNLTGSKNTTVGYQSLYNNIDGNENSAVGYQSLYYNEASYNTAVGYQSLYWNGTGTSNTACGHSSLKSNTIGHDNTAFGFQSLNSNTLASYNTAVGSQALSSNHSGSKNTAIGYAALSYNNGGSNNTASGYYALYYNTSSDNTANGSYALYSCTSGDNNTALGHEALYSNTVGYHNTATGAMSLYSNIGNWNTANGVWALTNNTSGQGNVAVGYRASYTNTTGKFNTVMGYDADQFNQLGNMNTIIGYEAGQGADLHSKSGCVLIGYKAGYNDTTSNKLIIENSSTSSPLIYGDFDENLLRINGILDVNDAYQFPLVDGTMGQVLKSDGAGTLSWIEDEVGASQIDDLSDASYDGSSLFLGSEAGENDDGTSNQNIAIGYKANYYNQTGSTSTILGFEAGMGTSGQSRSGCVFLGYQAGYSESSNNKLYIENSNSTVPLIWGDFENDILRVNGTFDIADQYQFPNTDGTADQVLKTDGSGSLSWSVDSAGAQQIGELEDARVISSSMYLGTDAGISDDGTDRRNLGVGFGTLKKTSTGYRNAAFGFHALDSNSTGNHNTAMGYKTLLSNTDGGRNTAFGYQALLRNTTGIHNTAVGHNANFNNEEGSYNTMLGYQAGMGSAPHNKSGNVFIGYQAGYNETGSNKLYIENSDAGNPLIYGDFDTDKVTINDVLILPPRSTYPSSPVEGELCVRDDHHIYCYLNGSWVQLDN